MSPLERFDQHAGQHIGLRVAVAIAYAELDGRSPDDTGPDWLEKLANEVALALSLVSPIYSQRADSSLPVQISGADLVRGAFDLGSGAFRTREGEVLSNLTVVRRDLKTAIALLQAARINGGRQV